MIDSDTVYLPVTSTSAETASTPLVCIHMQLPCPFTRGHAPGMVPCTLHMYWLLSSSWFATEPFVHFLCSALPCKVHFCCLIVRLCSQWGSVSVQTCMSWTVAVTIHYPTHAMRRSHHVNACSIFLNSKTFAFRSEHDALLPAHYYAHLPMQTMRECVSGPYLHPASMGSKISPVSLT